MSRWNPVTGAPRDGTEPNGTYPYVPVRSVNPANTYVTYPTANSGLGTWFIPSLFGRAGADILNLGGLDLTATPAPSPPVDMDTRRQPYFRTEMLQKVMNLTTVRTHQYAVWVTVGFFEVVRPGDPTKLIPDELGPEIGSATGGVQRSRAFFILDRSRATGFNLFNPGDYRECVLYRRRIE
jgi:hypothetical protein